MPSHKHAGLMLQYAQDAQETETPWRYWEVEVNGEWANCSITTKMFDQFTNYRRKPAVIVINGIEVPEPMRAAPPVGTPYFYGSIFSENVVVKTKWFGTALDRRLLSRGLCHLTEGAAIKHAEAQLSFTKVQD
jgi:hypothetical protein